MVVLMGWLTWRSLADWTDSGGTDQSAEKLVEQFYKLEQDGDYGSSWELFHSAMQEHFKKDSYIQSRAHVFMQDLGVHTFEFELGEAVLLDHWKMSDEAEPMYNVVQIPVEQTFASKFGRFSMHQLCYVTQEQGHYKLLWSYQNSKKTH